MRLATAFLLALGGPLQDDAAAEKLLRDAQARIDGATSLRARLTLTIGDAGNIALQMSTSFSLKSPDRWRLDVASLAPRGGDEPPVSLLSDGRRVHALLPLGGASPLTPLSGAGLLRDAAASSSLSLYFRLQEQRRMSSMAFLRPLLQQVKDDGTETIDGLKLRAVKATFKLSMGGRGEQNSSLRVLIDPEGPRIVRREMTVFGTKLVETLDELAVGEDLPDVDFAFQSLKRLNRARAEQAARSVDLFTRYAGRLPRSFADLAARPAWLEPDVFYPERGFGPPPPDPWGRPYALDAKPALVGLGADGLPGGKGEAEDVVVPLRPPTGRAIGAPSERLRRHFEARIFLQRAAGAVQGYRTAYGELPRKKAALWERPALAEIWPEGGWLSAELPADPWGEAYRLISETDVLRVQVQDPASRRLGAKALTAAERAGLESSARFRLTEEERAALGVLMDGLRDEDFEKREKAEEALRAKGPLAMTAVEDRLRTEKDTEARARLGMIRKTLRLPAAAWPGELGPLVLGVRAESAVAKGGDLRHAAGSLKTLASAQADFRGNDRDDNKIQDFWTGDVAGLYTLKPAGSTEMIKLIELSVAAADAEPLNEGAELAGLAEREPKAGYLFRVMTHDASGGAPEAYHAGSNRNVSKFGFCAYPAEYGTGGTMTLILNEGNTVFQKDTGGEPVLEWPSDADLRGWSKLD